MVYIPHKMGFWSVRSNIQQLKFVVKLSFFLDELIKVTVVKRTSQFLLLHS